MANKEELERDLRRLFPEAFGKVQSKNRDDQRRPIPARYKELAAEYARLQRAADSEPLNFFPSSQALARGQRYRAIEEEVKAAGYKLVRKRGDYRIDYM